MKPLPDKKQVLSSIAVIAIKLGRAPSLAEFVADTGFPRHSVLRLFSRWNDAVKAAGLPPRKTHTKIEDRELLKDWGEATRKKQAVLSRRAYPLVGKYDPSVMTKRFGSWSALPHAFRKFAKGDRKWTDVLALLPAPVAREKKNSHGGRLALQLLLGKVRHPHLKDRATYGNRTNLRGLRYEPRNEQGVVLLFGMLASDLGYLIESVQTDFPDCEAMRQFAPGQWQRVKIEFEFESRNFREHGHPLTGCDVIVCWRHNWPDCPKHIEVVELSTVIQSLASSED